MKKRTIRICGREWKFILDPKTPGGLYKTYGNTGQGELHLGTKWDEGDWPMALLLHEIMEAICTVDNKRWRDPEGGDVNEDRVIFVFDHAYSMDLAHKIVDSLKSVGIKPSLKDIE